MQAPERPILSPGAAVGLGCGLAGQREDSHWLKEGPGRGLQEEVQTSSGRGQGEKPRLWSGGLGGGYRTVGAESGLVGGGVQVPGVGGTI